MKKYMIAIFLLSALIACKESKQPGAAEVVIQQDTSKAATVIQPQEEKMTWSDSLIVQYIKKSKNELAATSGKDTIPLTWMLSRREHTDTADYLIYQLAHSFEDHLVTEAWLYIDSLSKTIYEYDVAADSLIKWVK